MRPRAAPRCSRLMLRRRFLSRQCMIMTTWCRVCMSDSDYSDDMMSCVSEALDDPSISDCDTAANGPAQVGDPGADAPKVHVDPSDPAQLLAADAPPGGTRNEEATPMSAAALVSGISERFGLSAGLMPSRLPMRLCMQSLRLLLLANCGGFGSPRTPMFDCRPKRFRRRVCCMLTRQRTSGC